MTVEQNRRRARRLVLLVWCLVAFFYFYLSYDYIRVTRNDDHFAEYLDHLLQLAGSQNRPPSEIRALLLERAVELGLPINGSQISIRDAGSNLQVAVSYDVDIDVPIFERGLYVKRFEHTAGYKREN